jgi:hypothetical protein
VVSIGCENPHNKKIQTDPAKAAPLIYSLGIMNLTTTRSVSFGEILAKTVVVHTVTYFFVGVTAMILLDYDRTADLSDIIRPLDHPLVMAGPLLQVFRGFIFATAFYFIQGSIFPKQYGWLYLSWLLIALGIISTFGPPPGSIEGMIYTTLPVTIFNYIEVVPQAILLSLLLVFWISDSAQQWMSWLMGFLFVTIVVLITLGLVFG